MDVMKTEDLEHVSGNRLWLDVLICKVRPMNEEVASIDNLEDKKERLAKSKKKAKVTQVL